MGAKIPIGLFYRNLNPKPSLDQIDPALQNGPLAGKPPLLTKEQRKELIEEFM